MEHLLDFERVYVTRYIGQLNEIIDKHASLAKAIDTNLFKPVFQAIGFAIDTVQLLNEKCEAVQYDVVIRKFKQKIV